MTSTRVPISPTVHQCRDLVHLLENRINELIPIGTDASIKKSAELGRLRGSILVAIKKAESKPAIHDSLNVIITPPKLTLKFSSGRHEAIITYWETNSGEWMWEALGNGGKEKNKDLALEVARRWIRDRQ